MMSRVIRGINIPMGKQLFSSLRWEMREMREIRQQDSVKQNSYINLIYYHTEYLSKQIHHELGHLTYQSLLHPCPSFIVALNFLFFISLLLSFPIS